MRKFIFAAIVVFLALTAIFVIRKSTKSTEPNIKPEILNVAGSQAMVAWNSKAKYKGSVSYMTMADAAPLVAVESFGASDQHEVMLTGLRPSTRYTYWLDNSETHFQFQTQPAPNNPFSFLIVWGDVSDRMVSLLRSESGEFIVSLSEPNQMKADWFTDVRPYVTVYNKFGVDSPFLKSAAKTAQTSPDLWKLDWGGLRLIFVDKLQETDKISEMLKAPAAHTIGIIAAPEIVGQSAQNSKLHSMLVAHNKDQPTRPAAFAAVRGSAQTNAEIEDVQYFGIDTRQSRSGADRY